MVWISGELCPAIGVGEYPRLDAFAFLFLQRKYFLLKIKNEDILTLALEQWLP